MRLLLTGATGQLGWELSHTLSSLGEVIALGRDRCDLAQPAGLPAVVRRIEPDVIVNAAAYTAVDRAEQEEELAFTVNAKSVGALAEEARRSGALLIHYSTDYVFDGSKNGAYTEDDTPSPINAYGRSKLAGDAAVMALADQYLILRTSWVYAVRGRNFVRTILRSAKDREELRIVADQVGAPTWARDIAVATAIVIRAAMRERSVGRFAPGLFNMAASGAAVSWHGFALAIVELARRNGLLGSQLPRLHPIRSEDYPLTAARPRNSRLAGERLQARFGILLPQWEEALALCLAEMCRASATVSAS